MGKRDKNLWQLNQGMLRGRRERVEINIDEKKRKLLILQIDDSASKLIFNL